jgi:hypothetical protein
VLLVPDVLLDFGRPMENEVRRYSLSYLPSQLIIFLSFQTASTTISLPSDSISLLPNSVALVDCGEVILVRRNVVTRPEDSQIIDIAMDKLTKLAAKLAISRFPPAKVYCLGQPGSPGDRLVFSRLSPSHVDTVENTLRRLKALGEWPLSAEDVSAMIKTMPYTDQAFFQQFVTVKLGAALERGIFPPANHEGELCAPEGMISPPLSMTSFKIVQSDVISDRGVESIVDTELSEV